MGVAGTPTSSGPGSAVVIGALTDLANVGAGVGVYRDKTGTIANLHSLRSLSSGLTIADTGDQIDFSLDTELQALAVLANAVGVLKNDGAGVLSWAAVSASEITGGAPLTRVNDTNVTMTLGGAPTTALLSATSLTLSWSGTLAVVRGGTGSGTALGAFNNLSPLTTRGDLLTRDASNNVRLPITGTSARILQSDGTDPSWVPLSGDATIAVGGAITISDDAVTDAKLRNSGALSVIGRSSNSAGDPADISAVAASDSVLRESGSTVGFGTITTGGIANDAVTYAKIQNVSATSRVLGRITAGAGDVEELTGANIATIANSSFDHGTLAGLAPDDDHTQYALLAGRAGGQRLFGGPNAGDIINIMGSSNLLTDQGHITAWDTDHTNTRSDRHNIWLVGQSGGGGSTVITLSGSPAAPVAYCEGVAELKFTSAPLLGIALGMLSNLFNIRCTTSMTIGQHSSMFDAGGIISDGAGTTLTLPGNIGRFDDNCTYDTANGGVFSAAAAHCGFSSRGLINAGTIATWRGFRKRNVSVLGGSITTQVGFDCDNLTAATNNVAFRSAVVASGTTRFSFQDTGGAPWSAVGKFTTYNNIATEGFGLPAILDEVTATAQTANIAATNFANAGTTGVYRVHYYLVTTTAAAGAGTLTVTIAWNDGSAAQTVVSAAINLATLGSFTQGTVFVRRGSGNVTYATTVTGIYSTSQYALFATCERLN